MNLLHHLIVADILHDRLRRPARLRGVMLIGAIAPDAHTERSGVDRSMLHPSSEEDAVAFILDRIVPQSCLDEPEGRAFALACVSHVIADEMTRRHDYHLPPHAPTGFRPIEEPEAASDALQTVDVAALVRELMRAEPPCLLRPLTRDAIDTRRWELLGRYPLDQETGCFQVVEPLASVARNCAVETLTRLARSEPGAKLIGSWRVT